MFIDQFWTKYQVDSFHREQKMKVNINIMPKLLIVNIHHSVDRLFNLLINHLCAHSYSDEMRGYHQLEQNKQVL